MIRGVGRTYKRTVRRGRGRGKGDERRESGTVKTKMLDEALLCFCSGRNTRRERREPLRAHAWLHSHPITNLLSFLVSFWYTSLLLHNNTSKIIKQERNENESKNQLDE